MQKRSAIKNDATGNRERSLKEILLLERKKILAGSSLSSINLGVNHDDIRDEGDLAVAAHNYHLHTQLLESKKKRLASIDAALLRINDGSYGICEDCGEEIPLARLRARPFATKCVECKEQEEITAKFYGDEHLADHDALVGNHAEIETSDVP